MRLRKEMRHATSAPGVLHIIDTLRVGGAERMAVSLVNKLPAGSFKLHLCTTRADGPLASDVRPEVSRLQLKRRWRLDPLALRELLAYVRANDIRILHAHGSSLFLARLVREIVPNVKLIWHNHNGSLGKVNDSDFVYRVAVRKIDGVISVNAALSEWAQERLALPSDCVWQLNNFPSGLHKDTESSELPGVRGLRVVCVASLRPLKGHRDLVLAMAKVSKRVPGTHLLLVGSSRDDAHCAMLRDDVNRLGLTERVSFLGERQDVHAILTQCSIGVLASHYEGLPLSLLEYGQAGLASIATDVGECATVLDNGACGLIVGARQPDQLAAAIERLLTDRPLRSEMGSKFRARVDDVYSERKAINRLCAIYERLLKQARSETSSQQVVAS